jgi:hypothetical protein
VAGQVALEGVVEAPEGAGGAAADFLEAGEHAGRIIAVLRDDGRAVAAREIGVMDALGAAEGVVFEVDGVRVLLVVGS